MKKLFLVAGIIIASYGISNAQTANTMSGKDARFGIKAGVNLSKLHASGFDGADALNDAAENNVGFNVTGYADFGVANNFFIQPGITLQNKGVKYSNTNDATGITSEASLNTMYVGVPLNAVLRIPTGNAGAVQLSAGPYLDFAIAGKTKTSFSGPNAGASTEEDVNFGSKQDDDLSSMDFGANFGAAYRMNNGFSLGAQYGLGLMNQTPKDSRAGDEKATNRVWSFTVGYSF